MRLERNFFLSLLILAALVSVPSAALVKIPPIGAPVVDNAGMLTQEFESQLNSALEDIYRKGGPQLRVLTLQDIEDESIEQTSIRVVDQWKLGTKEKDNGALVLIAQKQRRVRIEVGQGLEGDLTDVEASRIISQIMLPLFKRGEIESGVMLGVARIIQVTAPEVNLDQYFSTAPQQEFIPADAESGKKRSSWPAIIIFIIGAFLFIRHPRLFLLFLLARGGGGGGFGGRGGRGWSGGGGGGFSGGGASGGW